MANHLALAEHFTSEELYQRYRTAADVVERAHWQRLFSEASATGRRYEVY